MSLLLKVWDGSQEYTYNAAAADDSSLDLSITSDAETVELGDISLSLGPSFLGKQSFYDLPTGPFRAQLTFTYDDPALGEKLLINGRISRDNISYFPKDKTWTIGIVDDALQNFLERLEAVELQDIVGATSIDVPTQEVDSDGGWNENTVKWYDAESLWGDLVEEAGFINVAYQEAPYWLTLDIEYDDSGTDKTISRQLPFYVYEGGQPAQMPDLTGGQFFDLLHQMLGWRIRATYVDFPGDIILVEVLTDYMLQPLTNASAIDALPLDSGYSVGFESAQQPDFAIVYQNSVGEEPVRTGSTQPVTLMIYAGERTELSPDGEAQNETVRKVSAAVPDIVTVTTTGAQSPDSTNHPGYTESYEIGTPVTESSRQLYVCSFYDDGGTWKMLKSRNPTNPATGQLASLAEYWAINLIEQFQLSRSALFSIEGSFRLHGVLGDDIVVGDPVRGLRIDEHHWMVRGLTMQVESTEAELDLVRLESTPNVVVTLPVVCPPSPISIVQTLFASSPAFQLSWEAPSPFCGQQLPAEYEIAVSTPNSPDPFVVLATVSDLFYETSTLASGGYGTYVFRVRSKTVAGVFSTGRFASIINEETSSQP
jgi:hypothetical protein